MNDFVTRLDHLVVAATSLEAGVAYVERELGVSVPAGGQHLNMATHNHVMALGNDSYLEVIAIDPDLQPPDRPRWFGLDDPHVRGSLRQSPRLLTWAANTTDLETLCQHSLYECGDIHELQRGYLSWKGALTDDGRLPAAGFLPLLIQWYSQPHPSRNMADLDCRLRELVLYHPRAGWLGQRLEAIRARDAVRITAIDDTGTARIEAVIDTPAGVRRLSSRAALNP